MRFVVKLFAVVVGSVALGIAMGLLPAIFVTRTRAQPTPKAAAKVAKTPPGAAFLGPKFALSAPGVLSMRGAFQHSPSMVRDQTQVIQIFIDRINQVGANRTLTKVVHKELGRVKIAKGETVPNSPFNEEFKLPPGKYMVAAFCRRLPPDGKQPETLNADNYWLDSYTLSGVSNIITVK